MTISTCPIPIRRACRLRSPSAQSHPVGDTGKRFALIMECSGAHAARNLGIEVVLPRGALVLVGENAAPWTIEEGKVFRRKDFYMIRTFYFPIGDFEPNIALLRRYKDEYRILVDGEFGLRELPQEFRAVRRRRTDQTRSGAGLIHMASITIRNLVKRYGTLTIIPDLSLEIADHEFVVFVGPSGCGKSTLLRIIAGLEPITSGELLIGEQARQRRSGGAARYRHGVPGLCALSAHARLRQHVVCAGVAGHRRRAEIDARVRRAAAMLHIEPYLDRKPKDLSGGQRQRVAMGRAIVRNPQVFLFDEPLSNLDAKLRGQVRAEIKALSQQLKTTMVFVTHDQIEAMTMADRIVVLQSGTVQQYDTPEVRL